MADLLFRLVLLRHGEAERHAATDDLRPLSPRGREEVASTAAHLAGLSLQSPRIFVSTLLRARQTGEIVAGMLNLPAPAMLDGITPDDDPRLAARVIAGHCRAGMTPVFATHMPLVALLAGWLENGSLTGPASVPTAGAIVMAGEVVGPGQMRIERRIYPEEGVPARR